MAQGILFVFSLLSFLIPTIMATTSYLVEPKAVPDLGIPKSNSTVTVRIVNSTAYGKGDNPDLLMQPRIKGLDSVLFPCYVFLITNPTTNTHILFDLGIRKDWSTAFPPAVLQYLVSDTPIFHLLVEKNVQDILNEDAGGLGIKSENISSVIWSHHHFDHRGDLSGFPNAELIVGPGFSANYLDTYPTNPQGDIHEDEIKGHTIREPPLEEYSTTIGGYPAYDFFGNGSFYLLSAPGHTIGHITALARVAEDSYVFMGADCAHYTGQFRPTEYLPLPKTIKIEPEEGEARARRHTFCPGAWIRDNVHPNKSATEPFNHFAPYINANNTQALESIHKMEVFDAADNALVCIGHDETLEPKGDECDLDFYPNALNGWKEKGVKEKVRWAFISDFDTSGCTSGCDD